MTPPEFPAPIRQNGRLFWVRSTIENYKRQLIKLEPLPVDPSAPIVLVSAADVSAEFGVGRRTIGRRIAKHSGVSAESRAA